MRLTHKELDAISAALSAMLAGPEKEGDWPTDVEADTLHSAHLKVWTELLRRKAVRETTLKLRKKP